MNNPTLEVLTFIYDHWCLTFGFGLIAALIVGGLFPLVVVRRDVKTKD